jgi:hypothetical protein
VETALFAVFVRSTAGVRQPNISDTEDTEPGNLDVLERREFRHLEEPLDGPDVITAHEDMGREEWRKIWQVACLVIPALRAASWRARWIVLSWR